AEFRVNTVTTGSQLRPAVGMSAAGDFVIVWDTGDGSGTGIAAQRYSAAGVPQGGEFRVNTLIAGNQYAPAVAMDAAGDFVVAWQSGSVGVSQDGSGLGVFAQRYSAAGVAQGPEFRVNTFTTGDQNFPAIAIDAAGDFVVAWSSYNQDGSDYGVYHKRYSAA